MLLVALLLLGAIVVAVIFWWKSRAIGTECTHDSDCNSQLCLILVSGNQISTIDTLGICTELCQQDADCPEDMFCGEARRQNPSISSYAPRRMVCYPSGERLLEALE